MILIADVVGVLFAGAVIAGYLRVPGGRAAGIGVAIVAVTALLFLDNGSGLLRSFPDSISANEALTPAQVEDAPAAAVSSTPNIAFFNWAHARIVSSGATETFWVPPQALVDSFLQQWTSYALFPAIQENAVQHAQWIVFDGVSPAQVSYPASEFSPPVTFQPNFAIAERVHAS